MDYTKPTAIVVGAVEALTRGPGPHMREENALGWFEDGPPAPPGEVARSQSARRSSGIDNPERR